MGLGCCAAFVDRAITNATTLHPPKTHPQKNDKQKTKVLLKYNLQRILWLNVGPTLFAARDTWTPADPAAEFSAVPQPLPGS